MPIPRRTVLGWRAISLAERVPVMQQPVDRVRAASNRRIRISHLPGGWLVAGRPDSRVQVETRQIDGLDGGRLPLRIYRPKGRTASPRPVVVNFHGGGWVSGDAFQSEWWCAGIAAGVGAVVVSVEYRLAPEHRYPAAPEDCYAGTAWVAEHADELGVDAARLAVMGDSAGGNLAAVVSLMARDRGGPPIALQVLIYPSVELIHGFPSEDENADAPCLTKRDLDNVPRLYLTDVDRDGAQPYASPLRGDAAGLPPAYIQTAQYDPLRDQGLAYAKHLEAAGVAARLDNYAQAVHGYISLPGLVPQAHEALRDAVAELSSRLA